MTSRLFAHVPAYRIRAPIYRRVWRGEMNRRLWRRTLSLKGGHKGGSHDTQFNMEDGTRHRPKQRTSNILVTSHNLILTFVYMRQPD